jgi:hypothetical protein
MFETEKITFMDYRIRTQSFGQSGTRGKDPCSITGALCIFPGSMFDKALMSDDGDATRAA